MVGAATKWQPRLNFSNSVQILVQQWQLLPKPHFNKSAQPEALLGKSCTLPCPFPKRHFVDARKGVVGCCGAHEHYVGDPCARGLHLTGGELQITHQAFQYGVSSTSRTALSRRWWTPMVTSSPSSYHEIKSISLIKTSCFWGFFKLLLFQVLLCRDEGF